MSFLPLVLMLHYALMCSAALAHESQSSLESQAAFNKLVSASNYVVRAWGPEAGVGAYPRALSRPNLIYPEDFSQIQADLGNRLGIPYLQIGYARGEGACIYRIVVRNSTMKVAKLYFCSER
jgi:hypothetical protein